MSPLCCDGALTNAPTCTLERTWAAVGGRKAALTASNQPKGDQLFGSATSSARPSCRELFRRPWPARREHNEIERLAD